MERIDEDIRSGNFCRAYLLYGEETYLIRQYKNKLIEALRAPGDVMNAAFYEGKNIDPAEVIDLAETLPFFAERRLIVIEDSGMFKNACEEMAAYMKRIAETTCFLFVEKEVDGRSKMYKAVRSAGRAVEFKRLQEKKLEQWVLKCMKREKKAIARPVVQLLLEKTGNDMENIASELEKLFCYTMGREEIREEDVEAVCVQQTTGKVFAMVDCIAEKKQRQALGLYYDLLALREPPGRILYLIARQFHLLLLVKELASQGYGDRDIAEKAGLKGREFVVRKNLAQARRFTASQLREAVEGCVQMEEDVKTGKLMDKMAVELLIVKYSS